MNHREEILTRLRDEDQSLEERLESLTREADHRSPAVRQYRHQRVDQLRDRQHALRARHRRVESHPDETWDEVKHEAERLYFDLKDTALVASQTFH